MVASTRYVVSNNNFSRTAPLTVGGSGSKITERLEQGTNGTVEIYEEYMNPFRKLKKNLVFSCPRQRATAI